MRAAGTPSYTALYMSAPRGRPLVACSGASLLRLPAAAIIAIGRWAAASVAAVTVGGATYCGATRPWPPPTTLTTLCTALCGAVCGAMERSLACQRCARGRGAASGTATQSEGDFATQCVRLAKTGNAMGRGGLRVHARGADTHLLEIDHDALIDALRAAVRTEPFQDAAHDVLVERLHLAAALRLFALAFRPPHGHGG